MSPRISPAARAAILARHDGAVDVDVYWSRWDRVWIVSARDADDNQVGDAELHANLGALKAAMRADEERAA